LLARLPVYHRIVEANSAAISGRILAIDFGLARIGLAVSDTLGLTAQGLPTLQRINRRIDLGRIRDITTEYSVVCVLVGHPLNSTGDETEMSRRAARFASLLAAKLAVPVQLWDERMTSLEADRSLREAGLDGRKRRQARDRVAAQILLQSYLDRQPYERTRVEVQAEL
jgi:putative pre-16S rRNA nuclease